MRHDELVRDAYLRLFPGQDFLYAVRVSFSSRFTPYNASIRYTAAEMRFRLSSAWRGVSEEILIGLLQMLILKALREKRDSVNIALYHHYLQSLHLATPEHEADVMLEESFARVNARYFNGALTKPLMRFGSASRRTLGHYHYATDMVTLSSLLRREPLLLDYVLYHELLHRVLKYQPCGGSARYHTAEFRARERQFENAQEMEMRLRRL